MTTINFNNIIAGDQASYTESGYTFTTTPGSQGTFLFGVTSGFGQTVYNGVNAATENFAGGAGVPATAFARMTATGGGSFNVSSIDADQLYSPSNTAVVETVIGTRADGTTVTQTINLDTTHGLQTFALAGFTNLVAFDFNTGSSYPFAQTTNIVVNPFTSIDTDPAYTVAYNPDGGRVITLNNPSTLSSGLGSPQVDTVIYGINQPLTLPDNIENIVLSGQGGSFSITGNGLNNAFTINSGSWTIDGVSGNDTLTFTTGRAAHTIVQNTNGSLTITGPEGTEQVSHIGTITFSDGRVALDMSTNGAEVARLYDAVLHRQADIGGANAFVGALNAGATPLSLAQGLLNSAEGQRNYAPSLSNHDFVTALYTTVLGRAPDAGGQGAYEGALNGGASRASVLLAFADSAEHVAHIGLVGQGVIHDVALA